MRSARSPARGLRPISTIVPDEFHARFSAVSKAYEYRIWNARTLPPFIRLYAWHVIEPLDLEAMRDGTRAIVGEHDIASFRSARGVNHTTIRVITAADARADATRDRSSRGS